MTEFETILLNKVDALNTSLGLLSERLTEFEGATSQSLTELTGKIKGNHELLKSEIQTYVAKDTCENHREKQGVRVGNAEDRLLKLEGLVDDLITQEKKRESHFAERITAWMPSLIILVAVVGGIIWLLVS